MAPAGKKFIWRLQFTVLFLALEDVAGIATQFERAGRLGGVPPGGRHRDEFLDSADAVPAGQKRARRKYEDEDQNEHLSTPIAWQPWPPVATRNAHAVKSGTVPVRSRRASGQPC